MRSQRAKPLLGTLVVLNIASNTTDTGLCERGFTAGFDAIAHVQQRMSAHDPHSDLARLSRARPGDILHLDAATCEVLTLARDWWHRSAGAFDPCRAARRLHAQGLRPGLATATDGTLDDLAFLADDRVRVQRPVMLDLGGIAKGYAVDRAVAAMQAAGVRHGLVDAGGDMRAWGDLRWACDIRHAGEGLRSQRLGRLRMLDNTAIATSVAGRLNPSFVPTASRRQTRWRSATVLAPDGVTADVLTKWALQSSLLCPQLKVAMRAHGASMWRSE